MPAYDYYRNEYGGHLTEEDFHRLIRDAVLEVDYATHGRASLAEGELLLAVKHACCAVAEELHALEELCPAEAIASERVGEYSISYASRVSNEDMWERARTRRLRRVIHSCLGWTGLLYAGLSHYT